MTSVLVTGGSGLIGNYLCNLLKEKGYSVSVLSRRKNLDSTIFYWNIEENYVDAKAIIEADHIIHLAGAGIAEKRWTVARRKLLIDSRVKSTNLLFQKVKELNPTLKGFISASGIGYFGTITSTKIFHEKDLPGTDFLSSVCKQWENAAHQFNSLNIRTAIFRTGVVFAKKGGAFEKICKPIKLGIGSPIGNGKQFIPWIHIEDLCNMYLESIENNEIYGIYNAVAPEHITNKQLTYTLAKSLNKKIWMPKIPSILLKILLGKRSIILLKGSRVSSEKIKKTGFQFNFTNLKSAIQNLIN